MAVSKPYPGIAEPGNVYPGIPSTVEINGEEWAYVGDSETIAAVRRAAGRNSYSATVFNTVPGTTHEVEIGGTEMAYTAPFFSGARNIEEHQVRWVGAPNDSISELLSEQSATTAKGSLPAMMTRKTKSWAANGQHSLVIEPWNFDLVSAGPSYAWIELGIATLPAGKYTVRATIRIEKNQDSPVTLGMLNANDVVIVGTKAGVYEVSQTVNYTSPVSNPSVAIIHGGTYLDGRVWIDKVGFQKGIASEFFSGDSASDVDVSYEWVGIPNNSESVRRSTKNLLSYAPENCVVVQSSLWSVEKEKSARLINTDATEPGRAKILDIADLTVGNTYTLSGVVMSQKPTAAVGFPYRSLALVTDTDTFSTSSKSAVGGERVSLTFTVLPEMTSGGIYIYNGGVQGDPDVWWDALILNDGSTPMDYFDGSYVGHEWMGEPNLSVSRRIPVAYRTGGWPLKKFLSATTDRLGEIDDLVARFTYLTEDQRDLADMFGISNEGRAVPIGATSDLVDPRTANAEWLPWIAMLMGLKTDAYATNEELRAALIQGSAGGKAGTREAIAAVVRGTLSGPADGKEVRMYANSSTLSDIGEASRWDVLIVTPDNISPSSATIMEAIAAAGVKPAGISLHHATKSTTWAELTAKWPKWAEWQDKTWRDVETLGYL